MRVRLPDGTLIDLTPQQPRIFDVDVFPVRPMDGEVVRYQGDCYRALPFGWERLTGLTDEQPALESQS